ncbi:MAG: class IV adenylate cyclase [Bacillota bacterium]|nr:class IV adenylate cyclase [Bacillota bacterium]
MNELEIKVLNIDKDKIESKLKKIGCNLVKDEYQYNYIFDSEERRLKKQYNGYLRIRKTVNKDKSEKINLTLKRNIENSKFRKNIENNLSIDNVEEGIKILEALGYKLMHIGKKHRISYKYKDILFEIDTWDKETYPYSYLEIEVIKEEDIEKAVKLLDIDKKNITKKSIEELRDEINLIK